MEKEKKLNSNKTKKNLKSFIDNCLRDKGYISVPSNQIEVSKYLNQPIYAKHYLIGKTVYEKDLHCDFILYHPEKYPEHLLIDSKWQQAKGSTEQKFYFWINHIKMLYPYTTIILLDGGGYSDGAEKWVKKQIDEKLIKVFNMTEFQKWVNEGGL